MQVIVNLACIETSLRFEIWDGLAISEHVLGDLENHFDDEVFPQGSKYPIIIYLPNICTKITITNTPSA